MRLTPSVGLGNHSMYSLKQLITDKPEPRVPANELSMTLNRQRSSPSSRTFIGGSTVLRDTRKFNNSSGDQSLYGYLRDAFYNLRFKARTGVTSTKQLALSLQLYPQNTALMDTSYQDGDSTRTTVIAQGDVPLAVFLCRHFFYVPDMQQVEAWESKARGASRQGSAGGKGHVHSQSVISMASSLTVESFGASSAQSNTAVVNERLQGIADEV